MGSTTACQSILMKRSTTTWALTTTLTSRATSALPGWGGTTAGATPASHTTTAASAPWTGRGALGGTLTSTAPSTPTTTPARTLFRPVAPAASNEWIVFNN